MSRTAIDTSTLRADILDEYSTTKSVRKYTKDTAGHGISHLLDHDYGDIYVDVLEKYVSKQRLKTGLRLLEFGCGGGMNLLHLVSMLEQRHIPLDCAYGTDLSETLIDAANQEAGKYLPANKSQNVRFCVARSEQLIGGMTKELGVTESSLLGSFDLIFGVNTIRYCHRLNNENECVGALFNLMTDGGICIIIDMNDRFPAFRTRIHDKLTKDERATRLPTLDEYAKPFVTAGFEILTKKHFCWIPHSAGPRLTAILGGVTPVLNALVPSRAMRSLVIARKPRRRQA